MTPKPTKAGREALVTILANAMAGKPNYDADFNPKTLERLVRDGLVEVEAAPVRLTEAGSLAANEAANPEATKDRPA
jgi:Mn-dependent DtxR family transcriptional regulator